MEALRGPIVIATVTAYLLVCVAVGVWAMRRTRSVRDFFMAGRDLGIAVTGIAIFSSTMSGFGFVGGPGLVYAMGMSSIWIVITVSISQPLADFLLGKRLRLLAGLFDSVSLPDAVAVRYGTRSTPFLTAVAILLGVMGYLATQILAMATVLRSILVTTGLVPEVSLLGCVAVSCSVLVFYSVAGGVIASVYTDMIQGAMMVVAGLLVFAAALRAVPGGPAAGVAALARDDPASISPWGTLGMLGCLSWYFLFSVGGAGQPHLLTKPMMIRRLGDYRWVPPISVGGYAVTALLWIGIGLAMRALVVTGAHEPLRSADAAAPAFLQHYAHPVLAGVVFAGLFSAIMSTADAFLNIGAAALMHDIPRALGLRTPRRELLGARLATAGLALAAALFALYSHYVNARLVALLGAFGWGTFAAALVPAVAIGFNWKRATPLAADVAIAASLIVNFGVELFDVRLPHGIHGGTAALVLSTLLFLGISRASSPPHLDPEVEAVMDL